MGEESAEARVDGGEDTEEDDICVPGGDPVILFIYFSSNLSCSAWKGEKKVFLYNLSPLVCARTER